MAKFESNFIFVSLSDTNMEGNVYWTHYLDWFGHVREQFLLHVVADFNAKFVEGLRLITHETSLKNLLPAFFGDKICVKISVAKMKPRAMRARLVFEICKENGEKLAEGWQEILFAKISENKIPDIHDLIEIPEDIKNAVLPYCEDCQPLLTLVK
jgi:acyl-CoA thioesterase FadM